VCEYNTLRPPRSVKVLSKWNVICRWVDVNSAAAWLGLGVSLLLGVKIEPRVPCTVKGLRTCGSRKFVGKLPGHNQAQGLGEDDTVNIVI
jgi:hypothetical protein